MHMRFTECGLEVVHILLQLKVFWLLRIIASAPLVVGKRLPRKMDHLFITSAQQADTVQHLGEEARGVGAAGEAEDVDVITRFCARLVRLEVTSSKVEA